jgi:diacylglycerol kinase
MVAATHSDPSGAPLTAAAKRFEYSGKTGISALFQNRKVFWIALFASYVAVIISKVLVYTWTYG